VQRSQPPITAAACQRGKKVRFCRVSELLTGLLEAREERQLGRLRGQLARQDVLVLDEFGYVPASQAGAELLFDVISTAYEKTSVSVTTNRPLWPPGGPGDDCRAVPHCPARLLGGGQRLLSPWPGGRPASAACLAQRHLGTSSNRQPRPFAWEFTRTKLRAWLQRVEAKGMWPPPQQPNPS
jgi:hypothetical protein